LFLILQDSSKNETWKGSENGYNSSYFGFYIVPGNFRTDQHEVLMSDTAQFKDTYATLCIGQARRALTLQFKGMFEERPVRVTRRYSRIDIYVNVKRYSDLITEFLRKEFGAIKLDLQSLPEAPDPTRYIGGETWIPLVKVMPASVVTVNCIKFYAPRWQFRLENSSKLFLDLEYSKVRGKTTIEEGLQTHLGLPVGLRGLECKDSTSKVGSRYLVEGLVVMKDKLQIDILHSYLYYSGEKKNQAIDYVKRIDGAVLRLR